MPLRPGFSNHMNLVVAIGIGLAVIAGGRSSQAVEPLIRPLPTTGGFDYQLGGAYEPLVGIEIIARDATEPSDPRRYSICYVNGFQTQPGEGTDWLKDHPDAVLMDGDGNPVTDPNWPDEYVLDPGTPAQRAEILTVIGPVIDGCAVDGFEAVEIDNLDTWTRFDQIAEADALALATMYIERAHTAGLAIGQKNAAEIAGRGAQELGFDFAVAESCFVWNECELYTDAYGDRVLAIEYIDEIDGSVDDLCASAERAPRTIIRDHNLTTPDNPDYYFASCPNPGERSM